MWCIGVGVRSDESWRAKGSIPSPTVLYRSKYTCCQGGPFAQTETREEHDRPAPGGPRGRSGEAGSGVQRGRVRCGVGKSYEADREGFRARSRISQKMTPAPSFR